MRYFAFVDRVEHLNVVCELANENDEVTFVIFSEAGATTWKPTCKKSLLYNWQEIDFEALASFNITENDRVILSTEDADPFSILIEILSSRDRPPSIVLLTEKAPSFPRHEQPNVAILDLKKLAVQKMGTEWRLLESRRKALRLRELLSDAKKIAIVAQNDPDPDAIACGMALQALLGRSCETAAIVTFGGVTRNENIAMIRLLDTTVLNVTPLELAAYDKVVVVDVQPPYFKNGELTRKVDAVIDHHPYPKNYEASFLDVDPDCGATSTILFEYLQASETYISQSLATALLYGVVTDTMYLSRDTTPRDFTAFRELWPLANINLMRAMSRPRLKPSELRYFVRAIKNRKIIGDMIFIWLEGVKQEDIIPRLADFGLQFGEVAWSAVAGVHEGNIVISIRYLGAAKDAGKLAATLFDELGSAGGHKSAAKAVFPLAEFKRIHGLKNYAHVRDRLCKLFEKALFP